MASSDKVQLEEPYDDTDYAASNRKYKEYNLKEHELEKYEDRKKECGFPVEMMKEIYAGKLSTMWKGINCLKDPFTLVILQHLLWDVKPRTIIEFGTNSGGSAFYLADMMKIYDFKTHVYSMDIDLDLLDPLARKKREDVTFLQGDCQKVEETFTPEFLKTLPHPWFVTDDAHINTFGVFDYLNQFMMPGDYILIEDLDPFMPSDTISYDTAAWGDAKEKQVAAFMKKYSKRYRVDKRYTDFFGYNGSFNWNGFIKRI